MLSASEHAKLATEDLPPEGRLREHAIDGVLDDALRVLGNHLAERGEALMTHVARVLEVLLLLELAAGDLHLGRVDDDDVVAGIHMRRERGLVLAADDAGDFGREATEHHALGVYDEPALLDVAGTRGVRFHDRKA